MSNDLPGHCCNSPTPQAGGCPFPAFIRQLELECLYQLHEQWASTKDIVCTQPQPNLPAPSSPIHGATTGRVTTTKTRWKCSIQDCPESFGRRQERDRHEQTHLPYFIHCPLPHCAWRGNRTGLFKKHWKREDHRAYHEHYGHAPQGSQIETYDPSDVLKQVKSGAISLCEGLDLAILLVQVKAYELQKANVWTDLWGRSKK